MSKIQLLSLLFWFKYYFPHEIYKIILLPLLVCVCVCVCACVCVCVCVCV